MHIVSVSIFFLVQELLFPLWTYPRQAESLQIQLSGKCDTNPGREYKKIIKIFNPSIVHFVCRDQGAIFVKTLNYFIFKI